MYASRGVVQFPLRFHVSAYYADDLACVVRLNHAR